MEQGNLVVRKSYGGDIIFKIENMIREYAILRGVEYRLLADSPLIDLIPVPKIDETRLFSSHSQADKFIRLVAREREENRNQMFFDLPGRILHLDGDPSYLKKSMEIYGKLHIPAEGYYIQEGNMPEVVDRLLQRVRPDILVITGHDGIIKNTKDDDRYDLQNYKNSANFVKTVSVARAYEKNKDNLVIIAGACQSHFEAILHAGANFASSPGRVLIHALDPLYIAIKAAYTSVSKTIDLADVIHSTFSGVEGLGGIETRGVYRRGLPNLRPRPSAIKP